MCSYLAARISFEDQQQTSPSLTAHTQECEIEEYNNRSYFQWDGPLPKSLVGREREEKYWATDFGSGQVFQACTCHVSF